MEELPHPTLLKRHCLREESVEPAITTSTAWTAPVATQEECGRPFVEELVCDRTHDQQSPLVSDSDEDDGSDEDNSDAEEEAYFDQAAMVVR